MTRRMQAQQFPLAEFQNFPDLAQGVIHGRGRESKIIPVGRGPHGVSFFYGTRIERMGNDMASGPFSKGGYAADMIDVAMRSDHRVEVLDAKPEGFHVLRDGGEALPGPAVDQDEIPEI